MLCHACRVRLGRDFPYCLHCGTPRRRVGPGEFVAPLLVPLDGARPEAVPITTEETTIGRDADNDIVLGDTSVSRRHARISRRGAHFVVADLGSLNGVRADERVLFCDETTLRDGSRLEFGDVAFRFDHPRPEQLGSRTLHGAASTTFGPAPVTGAVAPGEPLDLRPRPRSGWALKRVPGPEATWVLSTPGGAYLRLDERDAFVFQSVDGENSVRDILWAYAERFGELALPRIERALRLFSAHALIDGLPDFPTPQRSGVRRLTHSVYSSLLRSEISVGGIDVALTRLYRFIGWRAFTRTATALIWATVLIGLLAFFHAQQRQRLFDVAGAGWWGAVTVGAGYLLALIVHETAHALAVKSYGRTVRRGGFMLMMGMPFAFVDTSDMWFGTRWSRVVVALAGPIATAALAGTAAMVAAWAPDGAAAALCFQLAFGLYMNTVYNFNPVMPLDGYQALTDALRVPRLRQDAVAYFVRGLWRDISARRRPGPKQIGLALYGLAAALGGLLFLGLGLIAWQDRIGPFVRDHVGQPWSTILVVGGVMMATLPVWVRMWQRLRRPRRRPVPAGAVA